MKPSPFLLVLIALIPALCLTEDDDADILFGDRQELSPEESLKAIPLTTDGEVAQREERARSLDGFSEVERKKMQESEQRFSFNADINRIMFIIIHSLYSNKEIFLRELISNASDALDKIRFQSLTNPEALGQTKDLEIRIRADPEARTLEITDTGIGMTKNDLVNNLGTVAQSGTKAFAEALEKGSSEDLIGQFGVGFYSGYLVADKIVVISKHNDDEKRWVWESEESDSYIISEDPRQDELKRGTTVRLHLKQDQDFDQYLTPVKLRDLIQKYSGFINFPIYLWSSHEEDREVEEEEPEIEEEEKDEEEEELEAEEEEEEKVPKKKTVKETVWSWEHMNPSKPIWMRNPKEVTEEEYNDFYKAITRDSEDPLTYVHFTAEGDTEFRAVLFLPKEPPYGQFDATIKQRGVKLYVRRVFINDDFDTVIPKYLGFVKGAVNSNDIPLNISREMLQEDESLQTIKKKVVRKAIAMFQKLADDEEKYTQFWESFGTNVKLGIIEDAQNRTRLSKLLRFVSSKTGKLTSFDDYVSRLKEGQEQIYYLAGLNLEEIKRSPLLEQLLKKGYEVLFMTDPIDEYMLQHLNKYDSKYKLTNVGKEGLKFAEDDKEEKEELKEKEKALKTLSDYLKEEFSERVGKVIVSNRLVRSPLAFVAESYGYTATMQRVMESQALTDRRAGNMAFMGKKVLEVNPSHPLIVKLNELVQSDKENKATKDLAGLLLDSAALASGYSVNNNADFSKRLNRVLLRSLNVDEPLVEEEEAQPEGEEGAFAEDTHKEEEHLHDEL